MRFLFVATAISLSACGAQEATFTAADEQAVRALEDAYRAGWLANDPPTVLATLATDAVLMPAGLQPLVGISAIEGYWWPDDGSQTTIHSYEIVIDEVEGSGDLAFLRGRGSLEFTYQDPAGVTSRLTSESVHLSVARRDGAGRWRIVRRSWSSIQ